MQPDRCCRTNNSMHMAIQTGILTVKFHTFSPKVKWVSGWQGTDMGTEGRC